MLTIQDMYCQRRHSKVPSTTPDNIEFHNYYKARKISVMLNPGDILFIPYGWWHFVTSDKVDDDTHMNITISNWTTKRKCDCLLSFDPDNYRLQCPRYTYNPSKFNKLVDTHTKLSLPFLAHSKLYTQYTLDFKTLQDNLHNDVPIFHSKDGFFTSTYLDYYHHHNCTKFKSNFTNFHEMGMNGEHVYLAQYAVSDTSLNLPPLLDNNYNDRFLWINFGKATSNLHYDLEDNLLVQIQGTKNVIMFPPSERDNLYPYNPYPPGFLCYLISKLEN